MLRTLGEADTRLPRQELWQLLTFLLLLSALSMLLPAALADTDSCRPAVRWNPHATLTDVDFSTGVVLDFAADTSVQCGLACSAESACCTFSYNAETASCKMHTMSLDEIDPTTFVQSAGTRLYSEEGACCSPPSIRLATPRLSFEGMTPVAPYPPGTEADYRCSSDLFSFFGDPLTCVTSGSWGGTPGVCSRIFYYIQVSANYGAKFAQPVVPGVKTILTGTFGAERLEIIYREDVQNSPLDIKFHLNYGGDTALVRMGTLTNGVFSQLSSSSNFPLQASQPYNVTIVVEETAAQIIVDDNPWRTFTYSPSKPIGVTANIYIFTDGYLDTLWFSYPNAK